MDTAERSTLTLRLPAKIKEWLSREARANGCSQNAEIIRLVRERMERAATGEGLGNSAPAAAGNTGGLAPAGNVNHG